MVSVNFADACMVYSTVISQSYEDINTLVLKWMTHMSFPIKNFKYLVNVIPFIYKCQSKTYAGVCFYSFQKHNWYNILLLYSCKEV